MKTKIYFTMLSAVALAFAARAETTEIKLATILPRGAGQDFIIRKLAEDWGKASGGAIELKISPGGPKDGEATIARKLNSKNYQAALLSAVGLSEIEPDVTALQLMPLTFRDWAEVDFVREQLRGQLEAKLRTKGFVVLFWADAGWVNFFSKEPANTPAEFKKTQMFAWAGSAAQVEIMKSLGYHPYPLETPEIYPSLASGKIQSAPLAPVFALSCQVPTVAPHVLDVNWGPIVGAAIIRADVWGRIPPDMQKQFLALCDHAAADLRAEGRRFHTEALATLRKGPKTDVHTLAPEERAQWDALGVELGPKVRGQLVPEKIYDEVQQLLKDYRATNTAAK